MTRPRVCRCGHGRDVHRHHHHGTYCGHCGHQACPRWRPARLWRPWAARALLRDIAEEPRRTP